MTCSGYFFIYILPLWFLRHLWRNAIVCIVENESNHWVKDQRLLIGSKLEPSDLFSQFVKASDTNFSQSETAIEATCVLHQNTQVPVV